MNDPGSQKIRSFKLSLAALFAALLLPLLAGCYGGGADLPDAPAPAAAPEAAKRSAPPAASQAAAPKREGRLDLLAVERRVEGALAIDGDTIELRDGKHVRYLGVDTPEAGEPLHAAATKRNAELIRGASLLLVKEHSEVDRYGRLLRHALIESADGSRRSIGETLIAEGLAKATPYPPDVQLSQRLAAVEVEARAAQLGIWKEFAGEIYYVGSRDKFHRPSCEFAQRIAKPARLATREVALESGRRPARCCAP